MSAADGYSFHESESTLEDGSSVYDVYFSDPEGQYLIANAASQTVAEEMADILNRIRDRFLDSGSDHEAYNLAAELRQFLRNYKP